MALPVNVDVVETMRDVTMDIRLKRHAEFRFRVWLGVRLIALAAWVLNCNIHVTQDGDGA